MQLNEYQQLSKRTMPNTPYRQTASNYALGLCGEAGEVADIIKKAIYHGHDLNRDELKKELGDVLHYLAGLCTLHGLELADVAQINIEKLRKRYPDGFSVEASRARVDEAYVYGNDCPGGRCEM